MALKDLNLLSWGKRKSVFVYLYMQKKSSNKKN